MWFEMKRQRCALNLTVWVAVLIALESPEGASRGSSLLPLKLAAPHSGGQRLEGHAPFKRPDNIIDQQYLQIYDYFLREIATSSSRRDETWRPDFSSASSYSHSVEGHRENLRKMLGLVQMHPGTPQITTLE